MHSKMEYAESQPRAIGVFQSSHSFWFFPGHEYSHDEGVSAAAARATKEGKRAMMASMAQMVGMREIIVASTAFELLVL